MLELNEGKRIYVESWQGSKWSYLKPLNDFEKGFFGDRANFRLPSGSMIDLAYAVKVEITGRKEQLKHGEIMIKGRITWAKDDPNEKADHSACWIAVHHDLKPFEYWL